MSTHYLIDPFTAPGIIVDVKQAPAGSSVCTGSLVVRVPDGCPIHGAPDDLPALLAAKTIGLQALYVGFTNIVADAALDGSVIDTGTSSRVSVGNGFASAIILDSGVINTQAVALGSTPTQCVVTWETFTFTDSDPSNGRFSRTYVETPPDGDLICSVSFNGGATYNPTTSGSVLSIPVVDQGASLKLRFNNTVTQRVYFGGWSLVY